MNRIGIVTGALIVAAALSLSACGGGGTTTSSSGGTASVRFVNGSPDVGPVDVVVNGKVVVSNLAYRAISPYQSVQVGTNPLPQVLFNKAGTQTNVFPPSGSQAQTFQLGAATASFLTIVIEGRANVVGAAGLNLGAFIEPVVQNLTAGTYAVVFHHASPSAAIASLNGLDVGSYTLGTNPVYVKLGTMLFSSQAGSTQSFFGVTNQTPVVGPPGIGFFAGPTIVATAVPIPSPTASGATPTPTPTPSPSVSPTALAYVPNVYAAILPGPAPTGKPPGSANGVDPSDVTNSIPFNSDTILYIYAIDSTLSPSGVELIGTFSN